MKTIRPRHFKCDCVNRKYAPKECGELEVCLFLDGTAEIEGVYLNKASVKKLIAYLKKK
jgi:hypothetical protein